jgi:hypothetical protein
MSLDLYAFVSSLPNRADWQSAVDQVGIDLKLDPELDLAQDSGFSPCELRGKPSGFEISIEAASETLETYPSLESAVGSRSHVICFRWAGDLAECACVMGASLALVRAFGAIAYYPADDITYDEGSLERDLRGCLAEL